MWSVDDHVLFDGVTNHWILLNNKEYKDSQLSE